jgi:hypothetical protein
MLDNRVQPTSGKCKKLFAVLLMLSVLVGRTFAADHNSKEGKPFANELSGARRDLQSDNVQFNYTDALAPETKASYAIESLAQTSPTAIPNGPSGNMTYTRDTGIEDFS